MTKTELTSRSRAFTWVTIAYLVALAAAIGAGYFCVQQGYSLIATIAVADVVGTVVVFIFSYLFKNSSFYDPYWSVIPIFIALYLAFLGWEGGQANPLRIDLVLFLVSFWGVRLTYNWVRGWPGLHHQDWRYDDLQQQSGRWYWVVSFTGIHLFPTILVFLGCLALIPAMVEGGRPINLLDGVATLITFGAIIIELVADNQLRRFAQSRKKPGETLTTGLWGYSRHPNYFGETSFWWGLFLFAMAADPNAWWTIIGPIGMTILFNFISIPMIEKRMMKRRDDYEQVRQTVPRWIPWFPKKRTRKQEQTGMG